MRLRVETGHSPKRGAEAASNAPLTLEAVLTSGVLAARRDEVPEVERRPTKGSRGGAADDPTPLPHAPGAQAGAAARAARGGKVPKWLKL